MFSLQGSSADFPRNNLKRVHEDDPVDINNGSTVGFTEHRNKRLHALPLRTSPTAKRWSPSVGFGQPSMPEGPNTITPADSDSEDATNFKGHQPQPTYGQPWPIGDSRQQPGVPAVTETVDMDMDMAMDCAEPSPIRPQPASPSHLQPGPFQPDPIAPSITGRMPTPIQPSFAAQVRGNNWSGAAGNIMQTRSYNRPSLPEFGLNGTSESRLDMHLGAGFDRSVPRTLDHAAMNAMNVVQNRSLPSPISESGGEDSGSPDMILDGDPFRSNSVDNSHLPQPLRSHSAMSLPLVLHSDMPDNMGYASTGAEVSPHWEHGSDHAGIATTADAVNSMETDSPATPSPKKGHTRSRHTLNSWTLQPGMKKSFSIGYRADCEKCRNKVPGHFNHIIVS